MLENRPGANGVIAMEACAKATPDGYTGCTVATNSFTFNLHIFSKLSYDPGTDFKPVSYLVSLIDALITSSSLPVRSVFGVTRSYLGQTLILLRWNPFA